VPARDLPYYPDLVLKQKGVKGGTLKCRPAYLVKASDMQFCAIQLLRNLLEHARALGDAAMVQQIACDESLRLIKLLALESTELLRPDKEAWPSIGAAITAIQSLALAPGGARVALDNDLHFFLLGAMISLGRDQSSPARVSVARSVQALSAMVQSATPQEVGRMTREWEMGRLLAVFLAVPDADAHASVMRAIKAVHNVKEKDGTDAGDGIDWSIQDPDDRQLTALSPALNAHLAASRSREAIPEAAALRLDGNASFAGGNFKHALSAYYKALRCLGDGEDAAPDRAVVWANIAEVYLRLGDYWGALSAATSSLIITPAAENHKAAIRRAKAVAGLGEAAGMPWARHIHAVVSARTSRQNAVQDPV
jgi:tetratricopeptide (TPR) repeat protein